MDYAFAIFMENYEYNDSFLDFLKEHFHYEDVYTKTYEDKGTQTEKQFFWGYFSWSLDSYR